MINKPDEKVKTNLPEQYMRISSSKDLNICIRKLCRQIPSHSGGIDIFQDSATAVANHPPA
jgi:hypothetical protein